TPAPRTRPSGWSPPSAPSTPSGSPTSPTATASSPDARFLTAHRVSPAVAARLAHVRCGRRTADRVQRTGTADPAEPLLASLAPPARLGSSTRVSAGRAGLSGGPAAHAAPHTFTPR